MVRIELEDGCIIKIAAIKTFREIARTSNRFEDGYLILSTW